MNEALLTGLAAIVGPRWVRHRRAELATYTMDGLPTHESYPGVVVLPGSRDELIARDEAAARARGRPSSRAVPAPASVAARSRRATPSSWH